MRLSMAVRLFPLCLVAVAHAAAWTSVPLSDIAVYPDYRASAQVHARDEARIAAEVGGRIESLPFDVGESVPAGARVATIDASSYRLDVERARAQVALVDARLALNAEQLKQDERLARQDFLSEDAMRIRRTERNVLEAERRAALQLLASAQLALARTEVKAPFAGVVRERPASVGDLATPGMPLLVLAASDDVEVRAQVPVAQIDTVRAARQWTLVSVDERFALTLKRVSPLVGAAGQTREVVFSSTEPLAPGLAGEVRWQAVMPHLPAEYVATREGTPGVWLARDGEAAFHPLPGASFGRPAVVALPLDTPVIDTGRKALGFVRADDGAASSSASQ